MPGTPHGPTEVGPLKPIRVIELGDLAAGAYAARLLADFGAEVIRIENPDPAGARAAHADRGAGVALDDGQGASVGAWFAFLNHGKQSVCLDPAAPDAQATLQRWLAGADVVVDSRPAAERRVHPVLTQARPGRPAPIVLDLSWFGDTGPYAQFEGSDAVVRALAGLVELIGPVEGPPLALPDYQSAITAGLSAVVPVLASLLARGEGLRTTAHWHVSVFEAAMALTEFQATEAWATGIPQGRRGINRFTPTYPLGIYRCAEGWLGITILTPAQWAAFCELLGLPKAWILHPDMQGGGTRLLHTEAIEGAITPRFLTRTASEWFAEALRLRLPMVIVPDMDGVLTHPIFRERGMIVPVQWGDRSYEAPGSPWRLSACPPRAGGRVPAAGEHSAHPDREPGSASGTPSPHRPLAGASTRPATAALPLSGLRIVDLSMGWAGPLCTRQMADLGADVIKVEACGYADWWRGVSNNPDDFVQRVYEKQPRFNMMNRNKRGVTLDLSRPEGVRWLKALVSGADAVVENYASGVLRKLGLDYPALREIRPDLVMVSMAAFGSDNAASELRAYGSTLEQGSGLPAITGRAEDPPVMSHIAYGDAVGGLNGANALLIGLLHRQATGEGQHIDLSQIECLLPYTAPWVLEQSATGTTAPRAGSRHPRFAPQGVYRCAGEDQWVLLTVNDDAMWARLASLIGRPGWSTDPAFATAPARHLTADAIDAAIEAWTQARSAEDAMVALQASGVAAGVVRPPLDTVRDPQLQALGYWQSVERAWVGEHPQPLPPFRRVTADGGLPEPVPVRWAAPTLGEHNAEVLGALGLGPAELEALEAAGIIGTEARIPASARPREHLRPSTGGAA